jgi:uncharacterized membrane protein YgdD (TMEM256/DUF423 family)
MELAPGSRFSLYVGALLGAIGVGCGAFGAHALKSSLGADQLGWWQTAVQYQLWHALALVALAALPLPRPGRPAAAFALGTVIFSGTLYVMALSGIRWLGAVTPLGGLLLIAGWLLLAWEAWRIRRPSA